jgi:plasmid stabilization system protein ParE
MSLKYRLARSARANLREISDYLVENAGPNVAFHIITAIMETIITLSGQPRAGVVADQFGADVRKFPAGKYMIYYHVTRSRGIEILHVFHTARNQTTAWTGERKR